MLTLLMRWCVFDLGCVGLVLLDLGVDDMSIMDTRGRYNELSSRNSLWEEVMYVIDNACLCLFFVACDGCE
jgi:hypothetical protein